MKPKHAIKHLRVIVDTQKTVSTERLKEITAGIEKYVKMLENDNRVLRGRVRRQREKIKEYEG